ncbi:MAG: hypothetical protein WC329_01775 [Candidatus Omnitrophota bacterium]
MTYHDDEGYAAYMADVAAGEEAKAIEAASAEAQAQAQAEEDNQNDALEYMAKREKELSEMNFLSAAKKALLFRGKFESKFRDLGMNPSLFWFAGTDLTLYPYGVLTDIRNARFQRFEYWFEEVKKGIKAGGKI